MNAVVLEASDISFMLHFNLIFLVDMASENVIQIFLLYIAIFYLTVKETAEESFMNDLWSTTAHFGSTFVTQKKLL